jgi:hypothetical protein
MLISLAENYNQDLATGLGYNNIIKALFDCAAIIILGDLFVNNFTLIII